MLSNISSASGAVTNPTPALFTSPERTTPLALSVSAAAPQEAASATSICSSSMLAAASGCASTIDLSPARPRSTLRLPRYT